MNFDCLSIERLLFEARLVKNIKKVYMYSLNCQNKILSFVKNTYVHKSIFSVHVYNNYISRLQDEKDSLMCDYYNLTAKFMYLKCVFEALN